MSAARVLHLASGMSTAWIASIASIAGLSACASHDGPFVAVGTPERPLYQARRECKDAHRVVAADGSSSIDWDAYERCMARLGWVKQTTPAGGGAPPPTGGGGY